MYHRRKKKAFSGRPIKTRKKLIQGTTLYATVSMYDGI